MLPALRNSPTGAATRFSPVNRLLERFLGDDIFGRTESEWLAMPISMWEDEDHVHVEVDAPGVAEKDIDVSMEGDDVAIRMERKCERKTDGYDTRCYGRFEQRVSLPGAVDADQVEAKLANGVLHLSFPKSEAAKPRKIAVKTE